MSTEQQYRVIGKSGPGVEPVVGYQYKCGLWIASYPLLSVTSEQLHLACGWIPREWWDAGLVDILEAISPPQAGKCGRPLMPASHVGVPCGRPSGHAPVSGLCEPPPQAAVAACESWCGLPFGDKRVPCASDHPSMVVESHAMSALCEESYRIADCPHPAYCTQACLDRAKAAKTQQETVAEKCHCGMPGRRMRLDHPLGRRLVKVLCSSHTDGIEAPWAAEEDAMKAAWGTAKESGVFKCPRCLRLSYPHDINPVCLGQRCVVSKAATAPECIRSACKAPPVAGGELCVAHAGQVEAAKARCAWQVNGVSACGLPSTGGRLCQKHEAELRASDAAPNPPPPGTRLERWRRTHPGYSHATADQRLHDANVAAMMVGIDGPREPYVPPAPLAAWTPRDLDGDIPDAWDPGGARLGRR